MFYRTYIIYFMIQIDVPRSFKVIYRRSKFRCWISSRFDLPECCVDSSANRNRNHTSDVICRYSYFFLFILMENPVTREISTICVTIASKESILLQIVLRVLAFRNDLIYDSPLYCTSNKIIDKISVYCLLKYSFLRK